MVKIKTFIKKTGFLIVLFFFGLCVGFWVRAMMCRVSRSFEATVELSDSRDESGDRYKLNGDVTICSEEYVRCVA